MACVILGRMTACTLFGTWVRTNEWWSTTDDGCLLNRFSTVTNDIIEIGLQAAITSAFMACLSASMLATLELLIADHTAYVMAIWVRGIEERGAAL